MGILDRRDRSGLLGNIVAAVAAALLTNGLIALANPSAMSSGRATGLELPGYVIGIVWVILFACLGAARWLVIASPGGCPRTGRPLFYLLLFCLADPIYTAGLRNMVMGLIGNVVTFLFALAVANHVRRQSLLAGGLLVPVMAWLAFATLLVALELKA